jgi:hypothetical protein
MDECVVEGSVNVGDTEDILAISDLRAEGNGGLFLWGLGLFWWLEIPNISEQPVTSHTRKHGSQALRMTEPERTIFSG